jgi:signal transduction histidine kinase
MTTVSTLTNDELLNEIKLRLGPALQDNLNEHRLYEQQIARLSAKLSIAEKCKSQFLSNVRNEINNPLTSILGLAASIRGLSASEKVRRLSTMIYDQAFELDFQMRNIITAAEIESGELKPVCSKVDIVSLLEEQVAYLKTKIDERQVSIKLQTNDQIKFRTDAYLLQTVCLNIISNAIEYTGRGKCVMIGAELSSEKLKIEITDFGIGIDADKQDIIFERFRQGEAGLTKSHHGNGLGLTIAKELVELMGGHLCLQSSAGKGTRVRIELPQLIQENNCVGSSGFGNELMFSGEEF